MLSDWLNGRSNQARLNPDRIAVLGNESCLTTAELENAVTALARQLREIGVAPGDQVAVCLERSPLTVVAFLAVLRVGGIYLPIDTQYPSARIAAILQSGPSVVVTEPSVKERLPSLDFPAIFASNALSSQGSPVLEGIDSIADDYPAYMMFTSGSTGASNGVVVSRGALARYVVALGEAFGISAEDVYLHTASVSFSASIRQLVAPLAAGATMVIAHEEARRDPFRLLDLMRLRGVTVWDTVPSLWKTVDSVLSRAGSLSESISLTETLRLILLTGEPLSWALVSAWKRSTLR